MMLRMLHRTRSRLTSLAAISALSFLAMLVSPAPPAPAAGCILQYGYAFPGFNYCLTSNEEACYECWYYDSWNNGFNHCFEDPSGEISHCEFQEEMQPDPPSDP